jgi:GNAT superfamily N-acetyltransferase
MNTHTKYTLVLTDSADEQVRARIIEPLARFNESKAGPDHFRPLMIALRQQNGSVQGGLSGYTSHGWLFVHLLVVPESARGSRLGSQLMQMAEEEAVRRGCQDAWLDTHEFQAPGFYAKLGYVKFGELPHYPTGFSRIFFTKRLVGPKELT